MIPRRHFQTTTTYHHQRVKGLKNPTAKQLTLLTSREKITLVCIHPRILCISASRGVYWFKLAMVRCAILLNQHHHTPKAIQNRPIQARAIYFSSSDFHINLPSTGHEFVYRSYYHQDRTTILWRPLQPSIMGTANKSTSCAPATCRLRSEFLRQSQFSNWCCNHGCCRRPPSMVNKSHGTMVQRCIPNVYTVSSQHSSSYTVSTLQN